MNPDDRHLLERSIRLAEENNRMIHAMKRHMRWSTFWGVVRFLVIAIPLAIGYFYVTDSVASSQTIANVRELVDSLR